MFKRKVSAKLYFSRQNLVVKISSYLVVCVSVRIVPFHVGLYDREKNLIYKNIFILYLSDQLHFQLACVREIPLGG